MTMLDHLLVPVASEADAEQTVAALDRYLDAVERVTVVHFIEKGGGAPDKAPLEKRQSDAAEFLAVAASRLSPRVAVDTTTSYGPDVVETLFQTADSVGATAIAFRPRGDSRIVRLLTGNTAARLVTEPELPVVSLPDVDDSGSNDSDVNDDIDDSNDSTDHESAGDGT